MSKTRRAASTGLAVLLSAGAVAALSGCSPQADAPLTRAVATFQVVDQSFKVELATPELVEHAQKLLDGEDVSAIPLGTVVRGDASVNEPWTWHIDPATLEFADFTTEVCDGLPEYVEDGTVTSDVYCPWSAKITAIEPLAD
ncbi:hypothetical protein HDC34_002254 [Pseudoclavibacter sp. JAI123]|uniref:BP74-related protein n=1 Tax=Pseudoclavibacter sp. JAI123 TaxID=2723065 RepID=UPI0015C89861|nr:hypothetical protein [Pseudoclavibacter sp. JAI123]NYF13960.1 hypothetical protein [Pseudoclavibacter sp. JAI123]